MCKLTDPGMIHTIILHYLIIGLRGYWENDAHHLERADKNVLNSMISIFDVGDINAGHF